MLGLKLGVGGEGDAGRTPCFYDRDLNIMSSSYVSTLNKESTMY